MIEASLLLVDDDPIAIQTLHRILADYSTVRFATNAEDALRLAREAPPDLILLDVQMPGMGGFELCRLLKADEWLAEIPVVFVTSHQDLEFETEALSIGASDFIGKPLSAPKVLLRVRNLLALKQQADLLRRQATTDALTNLANRRAFNLALPREFRRAQRTSLPLSLLMIDVDCFKLYNDRYGHPAGDECLMLVGRALTGVARRPGDLVARFGGEEFALLLPNTPPQGAQMIAERLRENVFGLKIRHEASTAAPYVSISVGISTYQPDQAFGRASGESVAVDDAQLLETADRALYAAKQQGRNRAHYLPLGELTSA